MRDRSVRHGESGNHEAASIYGSEQWFSETDPTELSWG